MVSVTHSIAAQGDFEQVLRTLAEGLGDEETQRLRLVVGFADEVYGDATLGTGERVATHALSAALIVARPSTT